MSAPVAIEVRDVHKEFERPGQATPPIGQRLRRAMRRPGGAPLRVLEDISFDVHRGEVMGLVGRNGSGKSTLLKLIAGIYRANSGRIRVAGRLAPLIELGVGFRPEMAARDNVLLNGVMMGLTPAEARRRFDEIIGFADLEDYTDLKLKNYSSGMKGRLGFSVMIHVDADVLLIDEILAVGDKAFREKCGDVFMQMRERGKTIMLVSHEMGSINRWCDRAMLLRDRRIEHIGEPAEIANRYLELNALQKLRHSRATDDASKEPRARISELHVNDANGASEATVGGGHPLEFEAIVEANDRLVRPAIAFQILDSGGRPVFMAEPQELAEPGGWELSPQILRVGARVENRLAPGRYLLTCRVTEEAVGNDKASVSSVQWTPFHVSGDTAEGGVVSLQHEVWVEHVAPPEVSHV